MNKFGPALRWMTYEAIVFGLEVEPFEGEWERLEIPHNSMNLFWRVLEWMPIKRLSYKGRNSKGNDKTTYR